MTHQTLNLAGCKVSLKSIPMEAAILPPGASWVMLTLAFIFIPACNCAELTEIPLMVDSDMFWNMISTAIILFNERWGFLKKRYFAASPSPAILLSSSSGESDTKTGSVGWIRGACMHENNIYYNNNIRNKIGLEVIFKI